jgi:alkylation response protein AidB-like acyl-CoA dehydrogenase
MQGLGSGTISLLGTEAQKAAYLPAVARGEKIAAFALTEPASGSDVASMETSARAGRSGYLINGAKTYISNGGIADYYTCSPAPAKRRARRASRPSSSMPIRGGWRTPNGSK